MTLENQGIERLPAFLPDELLAPIRRELESTGGTLPPYGIRHADRKFASIGAVIDPALIVGFLSRHFAGRFRLLRAIFFDKTPETNWYVTWHQDKTIAMERRFNRPGWGPWSTKDGMPHVQPPSEILEGILTLRIHLDDADVSTGCLWVIPGSHKDGVLGAEGIDEAVRHGEPTACEVSRGDALLMRPLLIHASRRATSPRHRRVLHLEFGDELIPTGLEPSSI